MEYSNLNYLNIINGHGITSSETFRVPKNTFLFFLSPLGNYCTEEESVLFIKFFKYNYDNIKNIYANERHTDDDKSKLSIKYKKSLKFLLFPKYKKSTIEKLNSLITYGTDYSVLLKNKSGKNKKIANLYSKFLNDTLDNSSYLILLNYINFYIKEIKDIKEWYKKPSFKYLYDKFKIMSVSEVAQSEQTICNLNINFITRYETSRIREEQLNYFYGGVIKYNDLKTDLIKIDNVFRGKYEDNMSKLEKQKIINDINKPYFDDKNIKDLILDDIKCRGMQYYNYIYPPLFYKVLSLSPNILNDYDTIIKKSLEYYEKGEIHNIKSWDQILNYKLSDLLEENKIYIIASCRSNDDPIIKECKKNVTEFTYNDDDIITHLLKDIKII